MDGRWIKALPAGLRYFGTGTILGIDISIWTAGIVIAGTAVLIQCTPLGRRIYAVGSSPRAARLAGIRVDRLKFALYTFSGAMAGLTAVFYVARRNTAKANIATGMELDVITAVVLGGASIYGGRGNIVGTVLGVLLIHEAREFVSWHWEKDELNYIVVGVLLIGSILLNRLLERKTVAKADAFGPQ